MAMGDNQNRDAKILSRLSGLSTEELKQYLAKAILSEDVSDYQIKVLMDILEEREKEGAQEAPAVAKSREELGKDWNRFLTERGIEVTEEPAPALPEPEKPAGKKKAPVLQIVAAACACIALLAVFTPGALAERLLAKWLPGYFWFEDAGSDGATFDRNASDETEFDTVEAALAAYHITEPLVPTWLPDGYELQDVFVSKENLYVEFMIEYCRNSDVIALSILAYDDSSNINSRVLKSKADPQTIVINQIEHYVFQNNEVWTAAWSTRCYECSITGNISFNDLKHSLKSIYE